MVSKWSHPKRGQALPLFAFSLVVILLCLGLAVDAGYAYSQNRDVQNASDFAAIAGARIVGEYNVGNNGNGTALQVYNAIVSELTAHNATLTSAYFTNAAGATLPGDIKTLGTSPGGGDFGTIPPTTSGVVVIANHQWRPFFLAAVGMSNWTASTSSTAITAGQSLGGGVFPVGVEDVHYEPLPSCPITDLSGCIGGHTSEGQLSPGNFGWLGFGDGGSLCEGRGLGMELENNCQPSSQYVGGEIPGSGLPFDGHGCCTAVTGAPGDDLIAADTGAKNSNAITNGVDFYITNQIAVWVPIWDSYNGTGNNTWVHVVGFAPMVFTDESQGAKNLFGYRVTGFDCGTGNTEISSSTTPSFNLCKAPGAAITLGATGAVELVH